MTRINTNTWGTCVSSITLVADPKINLGFQKGYCSKFPWKRKREPDCTGENFLNETQIRTEGEREQGGQLRPEITMLTNC